MDIFEKLEIHHRLKHCICLERKKGSFQGSSCGFVIGYSEDFVMLHLVTDFRVEGYQIIPAYTISKVRFDSSDKFRDKILQWEKQKENVGILHKIDLSSWISIFKSIKRTECFVMVEGEALIKHGTPYETLGAIKRIEKKKVVIHFISGYGCFVEPFDEIAYEDITIIEFNNRYLDMYKKYLKIKK